jgi:predicted MPP superfamily phosphohydrolase
MNPHPTPPNSANTKNWVIDRRDFLRCSSLALAGVFAGCSQLGSASARRPLRIGLVTDLHYADREAKGTRFYRESLAKAREAVDRLGAERVEMLAVLGDMKDMADREPEAATLGHLVAIEAELRRFGGPTYHVLGNHDMDNLSKSQTLAAITNTGIEPGRSYYAFSRGGVRFVTLDACFTKDGRDYDHGRFDWRDTWVPSAELGWLETELKSAKEPVIVLAHQRLDDAGDAYVKNSAEVRAALEASGKVLAVFQGHDHGGGHRHVNGIHYYTLKALVDGSGPENNSYAVLEVHPDRNLTITGYRRAVSMALEREVN